MQKHMNTSLITMFTCSLRQISNQPITWQQVSGCRYVDMVKVAAEVQTEHQNEEEN